MLLASVSNPTSDDSSFKETDGDNRQFKMLADSISQLAWMADKDGLVHWYNKRWYDYTGTTLDEMKGWGWASVHHPDHRQRVVDFIKTAFTKEDPWELTFPLRNTQGEYRWFLTRCYPVRGENGEIAHWIGTNTDIHQQTEVENSLRESEQRYRQLSDELESKVLQRTLELHKSNLYLKELNEQLERFNYASSHDLLEPIRKISLFAGKIKTDDFHRLSQDSKIYFGKILQSAERMSVMLKELLHFSTTTRGSANIPVDMNKTVRYIREDLELVIQQAGATIHCESLPPVLGVPVQVHQLFYNIIANALKFIKSGVAPEIWITAERLPMDVAAENNLEPGVVYEHFCVRDNGVGFEQEDAQIIFGLFKRLNARHEFPGTGIGLALSKKIVEFHGGKIRATSAPGEGATFYIALPAVP